MPRTTNIKWECDAAGHDGEREVPERSDPKDQPFGWELPNGDNLVVCAVDILKKGADAEAIEQEMMLRLREAFADSIEQESGKLSAAILSHRAELQKRRSKRA